MLAVLAVQGDDAFFIKHDFLVGFLLERVVGRRHDQGGGRGAKWTSVDKLISVMQCIYLIYYLA